MKEGAMLVGLGVWLLGDAIYSYHLYRAAASWRPNGERQTFWKDHWVRLMRGICALAIVGIGLSGE